MVVKTNKYVVSKEKIVILSSEINLRQVCLHSSQSFGQRKQDAVNKAPAALFEQS